LSLPHPPISPGASTGTLKGNFVKIRASEKFPCLTLLAASLPVLYEPPTASIPAAPRAVVSENVSCASPQ
jgi:hypothetical protein